MAYNVLTKSNFYDLTQFCVRLFAETNVLFWQMYCDWLSDLLAKLFSFCSLVFFSGTCVHKRNFVVKCEGGRLVWNQYITKPKEKNVWDMAYNIPLSEKVGGTRPPCPPPNCAHACVACFVMPLGAIVPLRCTLSYTKNRFYNVIFLDYFFDANLLFSDKQSW